jgi:hypothetical protein
LIALQSLAGAIQAKYNHPVNVSLSTDGQLTLRMVQQAPIDTMKFTRDDCQHFAGEVARFAMNHYAHPTTLSYVTVYVTAVNDYGLAHVSQDYCSSGGPPGALPPDADTPDLLKGAGTRPGSSAGTP